MEIELPELKEDDYLTRDAEFWKDYRRLLTKIIREQANEEKIEKTPENIYNMAEDIGIKPTARYFSIEPSQVRYYIRKINNQKNKKPEAF